MLKRVLVGVITSPHGLHGEVNVYPTTDELRRFDDLREVILADENDDDDPGRSFKVERVRYHKGRPICKFAGLDTIEEAQKLRTLGIFVDRRDALPLRENEYYIGDLLECTVYLEDGSVYGTLADILKTGANDVYAVRRTDGSVQYLACIPDVVLEIAPEEDRIVVRPMKEI